MGIKALSSGAMARSKKAQPEKPVARTAQSLKFLDGNILVIV
jgi:hypothetical protein